MSKATNSSTKDQVLVEERGFVRIVVLNRPKLLNALSHHMVSRLSELFLAYEEDPGVKLIIVKGRGRAFCSGGDFVAVDQDIRRDWRLGANFIGKVYRLVYIVATKRKPQISFLNGIVMGGGVGVSIHDRFRVVTENTVFAMPENAMGAFPDVGASYFLSRLPGFFGEYLGLTGARLDGAEMLACGLATHFVSSVKLPLLEEELCKTVSSDSIAQIIDRYAEQPVLKRTSALHQLEIIDKCFSCSTVEEILSSLEMEAAKRNEERISAAIQSLKKASPTSLKIALKSIREGRSQGLGECLVREYRIVCHIMQAELSKDVLEGCRANLVDKDKNPKWEPSRLDLVTDNIVDRYLSRIEGWEDLKLPIRTDSKPPPSIGSRL